MDDDFFANLLKEESQPKKSSKLIRHQTHTNFPASKDVRITGDLAARCMSRRCGSWAPITIRGIAYCHMHALATLTIMLQAHREIDKEDDDVTGRNGESAGGTDARDARYLNL